MIGNSIDIEEVPNDLLEKIVNRNITKRTCKHCDYEGFYPIRGGYNDRYDCKKCGKEDAIHT